jgi:hypothetical protein
VPPARRIVIILLTLLVIPTAVGCADYRDSMREQTIREQDERRERTWRPYDNR